MSKKLKKTRIYQEPNYTQKTGYVLADGGANKPTGKLTFEELGKLLGSNPLIIVFVPDGQGSYTMYRQTTFDMNVEPQKEPIDFDWLYENVYKVMVCAAYIYRTSEHTGKPIFFFSGKYTDPQTNQPSMEFTRFDTTEDEIVTEHSIIVSTDSTTPPFTGGTTTITDRYVNIASGDNIFIFDASEQQYTGEVTSSTTYAEVKAAWDAGKTILMRLETTYGDHQIWPLIDVNYESDMFIFYFPGDEQQFDWQKPNYYQVIKTEIDKNFIYLWKGTSGNTDRYQKCNLRLKNLNNYVAKEAGKGLSTNDYTNADKSTVTLAAASIPSSASSSNMLTTVTDVEIIAGRTGGYKKVAKDPHGYPDVQNPSNKLIYLTLNDTQSGSNFYDEWLYDSAALTNWELIGSTQMDLTGYATEAWVNQQGFVESGELADYAKAADLQNLSDVVDSHADAIEAVELDVSEVSAAVDEINSHLGDYATETWTAKEIERATSGKMDASDSSAFYPMGSNPSGYLTQHQDLSEYAKTADMNQAILSATSGKMDDSRASEFYPSNNPSGFIDQTYLNGLATEQWVNEHTSAFITSSYLAPYAKSEDLEALSDDLTDFTDDFTSKLDEVSGSVDQIIDTIGDISAEFDEKLEDKMDKDESSAFYPMDSNPAGYLVDEDLEDYATKSYVDDGLGNTSAWAKATFASASQLDDYYPNTNPSGFLTNSDLAGLATETYVQSQTSGKLDKSSSGAFYLATNPDHFVTSGELATLSAKIESDIPSLEGYATSAWVEEQGYLTSVPAEYVTDTEMGNAIEAATSGKMDKSTSAQFYPRSTNPEHYVTSGELSTLSAKIEGDIPSIEGLAAETWVQANFASASQISDMATQTWVDQQGFLTEVPDTYATSAWVAATFASASQLDDYYPANNPSGFLTSDDVAQSDWTETDSADPAYIKNKPAALSMAAGEGIQIVESNNTITFSVSGDYAERSDLDDYYPKTNPSGFLTEVPAEYVTDTELQTALDDYGTSAWVLEQLDEKVDKVTGMGLSHEDFTSAYKDKLDHIEASANKNVQSDWTESDSASDAFIQHKPDPISLMGIDGIEITESNNNLYVGVSGDFATNDDLSYVSAHIPSLAGYATENYVQQETSGKVDQVPGKDLSTNDFTDALLDKLNSIEASAQKNVQSDWTETNSAADSYIFHKPDPVTLSAGPNVSITEVGGQIVIGATVPDVSGKADKVSSATQGHLAALSSDGNLLDSTYSPDSFATSAEMDAIEAKIPANATSQNKLVTRSDLDAAITGAFDVVPLGPNDQPDVAYPNGKTIYLTKDSSLQVTDPYTEWIWLSGTSAFEVIGETTIDLTDYATQNYVQQQTSGKVDKVAGMGLSHVDFTSAYQSKLDSIAPSAEVNVQSDWNVTNSALDSYIANKPDVLIPQVGAGVTDVPKYIMVVTAMPPAAQIDPNTIYLVQGTYIGT